MSHDTLQEVDIDVTDNVLSDETRLASSEEQVSFLKDLIESIETQTITPCENEAVLRFFNSYKNPTVTTHKDEKYTEEEMIKFLFLGWYIYTMVLDCKRCPNCSR